MQRPPVDGSVQANPETELTPLSARGGGRASGPPAPRVARDPGTRGGMRLSLPARDALWLRACETCPATPPSRLVQAALEHLLADAETGYVPGPPAGAGERLRRLERRLRSEARSAYEE